MEAADIAALGVLFFKDGCRGGREPRKKFALVVKPLFDGRYLSRLGLYRRRIILKCCKLLPLLLHVSPERLLSRFKCFLSLL